MAEATQELKDKISQDGSEDSNGSRLPGKGVVIPADESQPPDTKPSTERKPDKAPNGG